MDRILSGIKPTGNLTLGNYIGALRNFKNLQDQGELYIFIADLHALTMPIDPEELRENSRDIAAFYLASGLDPEKTTIFLQHDVSAHAELNAILQNYLYMGELNRMTQFKDKCSKMKEKEIGLGIFAYPVLMACDILLYNPTFIPVGDDQVQHVELTRTVAKRFNHKYGDTFIMPKAKTNKVGGRIMSLSNPTVKMSKSDPKGDIFLKDPLSVTKKKIMRAVTDSGDKVYYDPINKPGISNLLTIYASLSDITIEEAEKLFVDSRYGDFKKAVYEAVEKELKPFQERYKQIIADGSYKKVLKDGAAKASIVANQTLKNVQQAVGLLDIDE